MAVQHVISISFPLDRTINDAVSNIFEALKTESFFLKSPAQADPGKFFLFVRMGSQNMQDKRKEDSIFVSEIHADQVGIRYMHFTQQTS